MHFLMAARSSFWSFSRSTRTSSSEALTGSACSSFSARPVRWVTLRTPGMRSMSFITVREMRSVSSREVPGTVLTKTV